MTKAVVRGVEVIGKVNTYTSPPSVSPLSIRCHRPGRPVPWPNVHYHPETYAGAPGFIAECQAALLAAHAEKASPVRAAGQRAGMED